jgi:hypothetical protein
MNDDQSQVAHGVTWLAYQQVTAERDEALRQLEAARNLCVTYEQMCHMTPEEREMFRSPMWKMTTGTGEVERV